MIKSKGLEKRRQAPGFRFPPRAPGARLHLALEERKEGRARQGTRRRGEGGEHRLGRPICRFVGFGRCIARASSMSCPAISNLSGRPCCLQKPAKKNNQEPRLRAAVKFTVQASRPRQGQASVGLSQIPLVEPMGLDLSAFQYTHILHAPVNEHFSAPDTVLLLDVDASLEVFQGLPKNLHKPSENGCWRRLRRTLS